MITYVEIVCLHRVIIKYKHQFLPARSTVFNNGIYIVSLINKVLNPDTEVLDLNLSVQLLCVKMGLKR